MQYDLFVPGHDLDLRSNFKFDLWISNYISFDASWWNNHGGVRIVSLPRFELELLQKNDFRENQLFWPCMTSGGQTVGLIFKRLKLSRTSVQRAVGCFFPRLSSPSSFRAIDGFVWKCRNRQNLTFLTSGDVIFDLIKKLTNVLSSWFLMSFRTPPCASCYDV